MGLVKRSILNTHSMPQLQLGEPNGVIDFTLTFLLIAVLAGLLGFGGMTTGAAGLAQIVGLGSLGLFAAALIAGFAFKPSPLRL